MQMAEAPRVLMERVLGQLCWCWLFTLPKPVCLASGPSPLANVHASTSPGVLDFSVKTKGKICFWGPPHPRQTMQRQTYSLQEAKAGQEAVQPRPAPDSPAGSLDKMLTSKGVGQGSANDVALIFNVFLAHLQELSIWKINLC